MESISPLRAFLAYLALHAPQSLALADFFSILLQNAGGRLSLIRDPVPAQTATLLSISTFQTLPTEAVFSQFGFGIPHRYRSEGALLRQRALPVYLFDLCTELNFSVP